MKHHTRIKICGITRISDAQYIASLGVDAIGLNFHRHSPRFIDIAPARAIRQAIAPFVTIVALFMDENEDWIEQVIKEVNPDCLQFHGDESQEFCQQWSVPYLKTIGMGSVTDIEAYASLYATAQGYLLDSNRVGQQGGSGDTFDWSSIPSSFNHPLILAGGLHPANVAEAITVIKPWAVDVSSGVEKSKGEKDLELIKRFCQEVKRGDGDV